MGRQLYQYHPVVGYTKMPSMRFRLRFADGAFRYRTNAAGFRGNGEFETKKPPATRRVLVYGDSFTEGGCVPDGVRYSDRLEQAMDGVEFYNFGISGTGTDQQYLIHREIGSTYEHDLVIIGVWMENIRRNVSRSRIHGDQDGNHILTPKPYFEIVDDDLVLRNQPVPRPVPLEAAADDDLDRVDPGTLARTGVRNLVAGALDTLGPGAKRLAQRASRWQPFPEYDDPDGEPWSLTKRILQRWAAESSVPVVVVPIPVYQYIEQSASASAARARFAELHDPPDLTVHDPLADFWAHSPEVRQGFRFPNDHHFTPAGHQVLADSLRPVVEKGLRP